ncbi:MAG TPA: hypothetical protein PKM73_05660 [Verrucomicrobiota bacterium]|nr:hypothetical protein [Verrucomicrobiota bacterium]
MQKNGTLGWLALSLVLALSRIATGAGAWQPHEIRQINGTAEEVRLPAQLQIVTESWKRVVAVPYLAYVPEKDRVLMLVGCDYPHHAEVLFSDDQGASWSPPKPATIGAGITRPWSSCRAGTS